MLVWFYINAGRNWINRNSMYQNYWWYWLLGMGICEYLSRLLIHSTPNEKSGIEHPYLCDTAFYIVLAVGRNLIRHNLLNVRFFSKVYILYFWSVHTRGYYFFFYKL